MKKRRSKDLADLLLDPRYMAQLFAACERAEREARARQRKERERLKAIRTEAKATRQ
jgi:hypothetical protein